MVEKDEWGDCVQVLRCSNVPVKQLGNVIEVRG